MLTFGKTTESWTSEKESTRTLENSNERRTSAPEMRSPPDTMESTVHPDLKMNFMLIFNCY